jgi:hypothetical protein
MTDAERIVVTPEQIADGWIAWGGGECPVPLDSRPGIVIRGFSRTHDASGDKAEDYDWTHCPSCPSAHIIAYRPEQANAK